MKKFSDKYLNDVEILKHAVVGFEFEFYTRHPYYKFLELMNKLLAPVKTWGFRKYHSDFVPDQLNFKLEADQSGGPNMAEYITGPLPYTDARIILLKILKFLQEHAETDEKCSVHINISFAEGSERILPGLNPLRLILDVDEDFVYRMFPERINNYYAKSVKKIIPFKGYAYAQSAAQHLATNLQLPDTKYFGININGVQKGRLEYRYVGGKDYQYKTSEILQLMDYFIILTWNNIDVPLDDETTDKLKEYLEENISTYRNYGRLENFIGEFPSINLQVDRMSDYITVNTHYGDIYDEIYDLISNTSGLKDCVLNYDTEARKLEVICANVRSVFTVKNIVLVDCDLEGGNFEDCEIVESVAKNAFLTNCRLVGTQAFKCRITGSSVDSSSEIEDCYFYEGVMDGTMKGGVFRSGRVGDNGTLDDRVRIITDTNNWFNAPVNHDIEKKKGGGSPKGSKF